MGIELQVSAATSSLRVDLATGKSAFRSIRTTCNHVDLGNSQTRNRILEITFQTGKRVCILDAIDTNRVRRATAAMNRETSIRIRNDARCQGYNLVNQLPSRHYRELRLREF